AVIQVLEACCNPGNGIIRVKQGINPLQGFGQYRVDGLGTTLVRAVFGNLEDFAFCLIEQFNAVPPLRVKGTIGNFLGNLDQPTQHGPFLDNGCVGPDVGGAGD